MNKNRLLKAALYYHEQDHLCVIPVVAQNKMPALATWEEYQTRCSTREEVLGWFENGKRYNVGIVHGPVSGNYITLDIDHDAGVFKAIRADFPQLCSGRLEQSGSGKGYHIPLRLGTLPDFGTRKNGQQRGNRTWKTPLGSVNIRSQFCQTVAPPSIHPSGKHYKFLHWGEIINVENLNGLMAWLDELVPKEERESSQPLQKSKKRTTSTNGQSLIDAVKDAWPGALDVFRHFGKATQIRKERDGEIRLCDNGGLLISGEDPSVWYCFEDEIGGAQIEAWGWCRFGTMYNKKTHMRQVLLEMGRAAGIDVASFYRRGDEQVTQQAQEKGDRSYWTKQYKNRWERLR